MITNLNNMDLRSQTIVSADRFKMLQLPAEVGPTPALEYPEEQYVLRMCIKDPQSSIVIPKELEWLSKAIAQARVAQDHLGIRHPYMYVTVRCGSKQFPTTDEWHVDGFSTRISHLPEQNYIFATNCPTQYAARRYNIPLNFDPLVHNINTLLEPQVRDQDIYELDEDTMYLIDPYVLHRCPEIPEGMWRCFVRISFTPIQINDINNTQNPLLPQTYTQDGVAYRNSLFKYEVA